MTKTEVAALLAVCAAAYPHVNVTRETAAVYAEMLADLDYADALAAVKRLIATSQFFPTVAAIRETTVSLTAPPIPSNAAAWAEVMLKIREVGHYRAPEWSHPALAEAVATIGWRELCMADNLAVSRAHFWKVYETAARDAHKAAVLPASLRALEAP